jgi:hypothetical protein
VLSCVIFPASDVATNAKYQLACSSWWKDMDSLEELFPWNVTSDCHQRHNFCSYGSRSEDTVSGDAAKSRLYSCYVWRWS